MQFCILVVLAVLGGPVLCDSSRSSVPEQPAFMFSTIKVIPERSGFEDFLLSLPLFRQVTETYRSWVTERLSQIIFDCCHRLGYHENMDPQQLQICRNHQYKVEAIILQLIAVFVMGIMQLFCGIRQEYRGYIIQSEKRSLLQVPLFLYLISTSRGVIRRGLNSSDETRSLSSVSFSTDNSDSDNDDLEGFSFSSAGVGASVRVDEPECISEDSLSSVKQHEQPSISSDQILLALEGALLKSSQASKKTQGMIETMMGIQCANLGNEEKAVGHFETGSQLDYSKAQYNLGQCYELGKGVQRDIVKAFKLYKKAADQDHPLALYKLGAYHYHGIGGTSEDESAGVSFMERAASLGVILAHSFVGNYYLQSKTRDLHRGIFHLKAAVEEQEPESEYLLGLCYEQGWGVTQDHITATSLYQRAAEGGYPLAMYSLGVYYEKGIGGVIEDKRQAKHLYKDASERGLDLATKRLEKLCLLEKQEQRQTEDEDEKESNYHVDSNLINKVKPLDASNLCIHVSFSEPCLPARGEETRNLRESSVTLSYLNLILPAIIRTNGTTGSFNKGSAAKVMAKDQVNFQIGADEDNISIWRMEPVNNIQLTV